MSITDLLQALAVVVIWGLNFVVIKIAVSEIPPLALTAIRFLAAALIIAPFFRPRRDQFPIIIGLAVVMGAGHFGMLFVGLQGADAATVALILQLGILCLPLPFVPTPREIPAICAERGPSSPPQT